jgi:hypothetical protein
MLSGLGGDVHMSSVRVSERHILDVGDEVRAMIVIVLMEEQGADEVQGQANAANDQDQLGALDLLDKDEALDGLQEDAQAQGKEEGAVEEGAEKRRSSPAEGEVLRRGLAFSGMDGDKRDDEADKVIELGEGQVMLLREAAGYVRSGKHLLPARGTWCRTRP